VILRVFPFANSAHGSRRNRYPPAGTGEIVAVEVVHRSRHTVPNERGLIHRKRSLACKSQAAHARKGQGDETTMTNELKKDAVYCVHFPEGEDLPVIKHSKNIPADWRACFRYEDDAKEFCEKIQASQAESYL